MVKAGALRQNGVLSGAARDRVTCDHRSRHRVGEPRYSHSSGVGTAPREGPAWDVPGDTRGTEDGRNAREGSEVRTGLLKMGERRLARGWLGTSHARGGLQERHSQGGVLGGPRGRAKHEGAPSRCCGPCAGPGPLSRNHALTCTK